jgi:hypothetical protein
VKYVVTVCIDDSDRSFFVSADSPAEAAVAAVARREWELSEYRVASATADARVEVTAMGAGDREVFEVSGMIRPQYEARRVTK